MLERARAAHPHRPLRLVSGGGGDAGRAARGLRLWDNTLKVWDVETGRELRTLQATRLGPCAWR